MRIIYPVLTGSTCNFTLWAPRWKNVELLILTPSEKIVPMKQDKAGYWSATVSGVSRGTLYKYRLDNTLTIPDPGSLSQPEGVHGPSEVKDLSKFQWTDNAWKNIPLKRMIFYELHTGTFTEKGTFEGVEEKLDYLLELGINTIELMPVGQFPGERNWGYDVAFPFAVQNSYGGAEGLMKLINTCHKKNIAVILDVVYNHLGPEGNYLGEYAPYFTDRYSTPWGRAVNFDDSYSDGVRDYFLQNAVMWMENFHIDGLRLDAVHAIYDFSARHIMQELVELTEQLSAKRGRKHYLIAESALNDNRYITGIKRGGYGLDAQWNDDFHHGLHALATGENCGYYIDFSDPATLVKAYTDGFAFNGQYSQYRKRNLGNSSREIPAYRFVVFSQNHDQTGNRKFGERASSLVSFEMLKLIAGALFLSPFLPMLFMGEEYGERNPFLYFVDHTDKKLRKLVREGRRKEFSSFQSEDASAAPDPYDIKTFVRSKLTPDPLNRESSKALFTYYKALIMLRKNHPVLKHAGKKNIKADHSGRMLTVERWYGENRLIAFMNFDDNPAEMRLPDMFIEKRASLLLNSSEKKWYGPGNDDLPEKQLNRTVIINRQSLHMYSI